MTEKEVFSSENVIPNVIPEGKKSANVPNLRFPNHDIEWWYCLLSNACIINPKTEKLDDEFVYIDLESVIKGVLVNTNIISRENAPSRAQRVLKNDDICFQCVRPYQFNNYYFEKPTIQMQWVASTGYAQLRTTENEPRFLYQLLSTARFNKEVMLRCTGTSYPAINSNDLGEIEIAICSLAEQRKIANFLTLIDERIDTQSKIIEELVSQKKWIIQQSFSRSAIKDKLENHIIQISVRNKDESNTNVLSVSNKLGFIKQDEQFENREVASENKSNYKIVETNDFAYNPARINVGSIARLKSAENGIVSPMYVCFRVKSSIFPEYLEYYFLSKDFYDEMKKRLEGSVRQCLSYEAMSSIAISVPTKQEQMEIIKRLNSVEHKIELEQQILLKYQLQKKYLLANMFI